VIRVYYRVHTPNEDGIIINTTVRRKSKDNVVVVIKEEWQYSSPQYVLVLGVLFADNSAFVVSPLLPANSDIYGPKRLDVGNEICSAGTTISLLKIGVP